MDNSLNQLILIDLYGYEKYNGEELTEDFINNGRYEKGVDNLQWDIKKEIEEMEKKGGLATELFVKIRVLKGSPMFEHIKNGGLVKIVED